MDTAEIRRRFVAHFEAAGHTARAVGVAAPRRPEPAVRQRRHGAVQALLPGPGDPAVRPRGERAEVRPHTRHRGRRQDHPARHVLRDVRQLLLRRLLQGRCHRARLGPRHQVPRGRRLGARGVPALPERATSTTRRRVELWKKVTGLPDERIVRLGQEGELLVHGRARARWAVLGDHLRPRPGVRPRRGLRALEPAGHADRDRGPLPRVLEPGVHAGGAQRGPQQGRLRHRRPAAEAQHRHRHGSGAGGLPAAGQAEHVRDRHHAPGDREGRGAHRPPLRGGPPGRRPVPRRRRPRAQLDDARRRRGHPRQRGARLRPAPAAAPCGPLDAAAGHRGPRAARAVPGEPRPDVARPTRRSRRTGSGSPPWPTPRRTRSGRRCAPAPRSSTWRPPRSPRAVAGRSRATRRSRCTTPTASRST